MTSRSAPAKTSTRTEPLADDVTPPPRYSRWRPATVGSHNGGYSELVASATTEQLLHHRDELPPGHPARAGLRARVIEDRLALARQLARRYAGRGEPLEDLVQVAALALVRAVDGYDSTRGSTFLSYAIPTIVGSLKRHFRDAAWGLRVPRRMQELVRATRTGSSELSQRLGRSTTPTELAEYLGVTVKQLSAAQAATHGYRPDSLDAAQNRPDAELADVLGGADPRFAAVDDRLTLQVLVGALPGRERRILTLRFYRDMTQSEIAAELGLSQMHVSRLLRRTIAHLQAGMIASGASGPVPDGEPARV